MQLDAGRVQPVYTFIGRNKKHPVACCRNVVDGDRVGAQGRGVENRGDAFIRRVMEDGCSVEEVDPAEGVDPHPGDREQGIAPKENPFKPGIPRMAFQHPHPLVLGVDDKRIALGIDHHAHNCIKSCTRWPARFIPRPVPVMPAVETGAPCGDPDLIIPPPDAVYVQVLEVILVLDCMIPRPVPDLQPAGIPEPEVTVRIEGKSSHHVIERFEKTVVRLAWVPGVDRVPRPVCRVD